MTDVWRSQARKYCNFCKCWISDNKPSIEFHENGKKHKENVSLRLKEIHKNSAKSAKQQRKFDNDIKKMEEAAKAAYLKDIQSNHLDLTANELIHGKLHDLIERKYSNAAADVDPMDPRSNQKLARIEAQKTKAFKAAVKKAKECEETDKSKKGKDKKDNSQDEKSNPSLVRKVWYEARSSGYPYYWNIDTNESVWDPPTEGFLSLAEQADEVKEQELQEEFYKDIDKEKEKEMAERLEEQRANAEREKMKEIRDQFLSHDKDEVKNENEEEEKVEAEDVHKRSNHGPRKVQPYGSWQVVRTVETPKIDLQLPKPKAPIIPTVKCEEQPAPRIFKEKVVTHVSTDDCENGNSIIPFKKRKFGNKNVRKRVIDD